VSAASVGFTSESAEPLNTGSTQFGFSADDLGYAIDPFHIPASGYDRAVKLGVLNGTLAPFCATPAKPQTLAAFGLS
jgi:hypothetical protein